MVVYDMIFPRRTARILTNWLLAIGSLAWLVAGVTGFAGNQQQLLTGVLGLGSGFANLVYTLVGLAGVDKVWDMLT